MGKMKMKKRKATTVAYIEHVGCYGTVPFESIIGKLYKWAKVNKLRPGFVPLTIYPDNPNTTPTEELRSWVGIPVHGDAKPSDGVSLIELTESQVACYKFEAPSSEYGNSYKELVEWIESEGCEITGPPVESYPKKPKVKDGQTIIYAEIQFPVRKR